MHVSFLLSSEIGYKLLLHDRCLDKESNSLNNIATTISSYSSWAQIISLSSNDCKDFYENSYIQEQLQRYLFILQMMSGDPDSQPILIYVTTQSKPVEGLHSYESIVSQLAVVGTRCLFLSLAHNRMKKIDDYQAMQIVGRIGGICLNFFDLFPDFPTQSNPVHYNTDNFEYFMNSTAWQSKREQLTERSKEFKMKLELFLANDCTRSRKSSIFPATIKQNMGEFELAKYEIKSTIKSLKKARFSETFKINDESEKKLKLSLNWKPNIKVIYIASVYEDKIKVTISIKALKSVLYRIIDQSTSSSENSLCEHLRIFVRGIRATDDILHKLNSELPVPILFKELAALPVCAYHKWFIIKSFDILYSPKLVNKKTSSSYLTDYFFLKGCIINQCVELGFLKIDSPNIAFAAQIDNGFAIVKPIFFLSNAATIYVSFYEVPEESMEHFIVKLTNRVSNLRKLHVFFRPLHFALNFQPIEQMISSSHDQECNLSGIKIPSSQRMTISEESKEEERQKYSIEEAEQEIGIQQKIEGVGASVYTFTPNSDILQDYMQRKKWEWTSCFKCVIQDLAFLLAKQRCSEGFVLLNAVKGSYTFAKEEKIMDCSQKKDGMILLEYSIKFDSSPWKLETELSIEKKEGEVAGLLSDQIDLFDVTCNEVFNVDKEISIRLWSYHWTKRECLKKCGARNQNTLKNCGFFFDIRENIIPEHLLLKIYSMLTKSYILYEKNKYIAEKVESPSVDSFQLNESKSIASEDLYQNSSNLEYQKLLVIEMDKILCADSNTIIKKEDYDVILKLLHQGLIKIMEEFADVILPKEKNNIYAKMISKRHIVLLKLDIESREFSLIEYKKLFKDCFPVVDSPLMSTNIREKRASKRISSFEGVDEFINHLLDDTEIDFCIDEESELQFETSLLKIVNNFQFYFSEEYNNLLLSTCYNIIISGFMIKQEELERIFDMTHKLTFSFNVSSLLKIYSAIKNHQNAETVDNKLKQGIQYIFKEIGETGYFYYFPKDSSGFTQSENNLESEIRSLFPGQSHPKNKPLFLNFVAVSKKDKQILKTKNLKKFSEIYDFASTENDTFFNVEVHFCSTHKKYEEERYYDKQDMEDPIIMEDYYEQISEGVLGIEKTIASIFLNENIPPPQQNVRINIDHLPPGIIHYPFQSRAYLQLIPENYNKGTYIFSVDNDYMRSFYAALRALKVFFAEVWLSSISNLRLPCINEDIMSFIRLKMGELYNHQLETQNHAIDFVDYSNLTLSIFNEELELKKYNFRRIKQYFYVFGNENSDNLSLENDSQENHPLKINFWIIFQFKIMPKDVTLSLVLHDPYLKGVGAEVFKQFDTTFQKISKKVNQQILLIQLNETKECSDLLFPVEVENKESFKPFEKIKKAKPWEALNSNKKEKPSPKKQEEKKNYTPDKVYVKEFQVNERLSLKSLSDVRSKFLPSYAVTNRKHMYVMFNVKAIYVLIFSEANKDFPKQNLNETVVVNRTNSIIMEVYGIDKPPEDFIEKLNLRVESEMMIIALTKIAQNILNTPEKLSNYDYQFLSQSEEKIDLLFPVPEYVTDLFALTKYLAQNLKKFMITCKLDTGTRKIIYNDGSQNNLPTILQSKMFGTLEKFMIPHDDPDFSLVLNFKQQVANIELSQIFGNGLALVKLFCLSIPYQIDSDSKKADPFTLHFLPRYVPLIKYQKKTPWTDFVSLIGNEKDLSMDSLKDSSQDNLFFSQNFMIKHSSTQEELEKIKKIFIENSNYKQYLKIQLNIKGHLNTEAFINAMTLYTNQSIAEFAFEKACEMLEIGLKNGLCSSNQKYSGPEKDSIKKEMIISHIEQFTKTVKDVFKYAKKFKSPLFFHRKKKAETEYRNHIPMISMIVNDLCKKLLLSHIGTYPLEDLFICLFVFITNNVDGTIHKIYIIKNAHNFSQLYTFLKNVLTIPTIEMKNRSVHYQFIVMSRIIREFNKVFSSEMANPAGNKENNKIILLECGSDINLGGSMIGRNTFRHTENSGESLLTFIDDPVEEIMANIKAHQGILVKGNCINHCLPRTIFLSVSLKNSVLTYDACNLTKKNTDFLEKIVTLSATWHNTKSSLLTNLLRHKMGISINNQSEAAENNGKNKNIGKNKIISEKEQEVLYNILKNQLLVELNQNVSQDRQVTSRASIIGMDALTDTIASKTRQYANSNYLIKLTELTCSILPGDKIINSLQGNSIKLSDFELTSALLPSDHMRINYECSSFNRNVQFNQKALKSLCINPLFYHSIQMQMMYQKFKKDKEDISDILLFNSKLAKGDNDEITLDKRERIDKLFKYMNLDSLPEKDLRELIPSILGASHLSYSFSIPFLFNQQNDSSIVPGEIIEEPSETMKSFVKILGMYFENLCEMIKSYCNVTQGLISNMDSNIRNAELIGSERSEYQQIGRSWSYHFHNEEVPVKWRKVTSSSSLSSKSSIEKDEKIYAFTHQASCRGSGHKLPTTRFFKLKSCQAYLIKREHDAIYLIEIECIHNTVDLRIWMLNDIINQSLISSFDKIQLNETDRVADYFNTVMKADSQLTQIISSLRLDAFNYDIHIQYLLLLLTTIRQQCSFWNIITSFIKYYPEPPKKARNNLKARLVTIQMGDIEKNPYEFWCYFIKHAQRYGYKSLIGNKLAYSGNIENESSEGMKSLCRDASNGNKNSIDNNAVEIIQYSPVENSVIVGMKKVKEEIKKAPNKKILKNSISIDADKPEDANQNVKSSGESNSSHKDAQNYSSYAVFMYCTNVMESESVFRSKRTMIVNELEENNKSPEEANILHIAVCGIQASRVKFEEYGRIPETNPPQVMYHDIEVIVLSSMFLGKAI